MTDTPQPDRRERYAEALYATLELSPDRHPWTMLHPFRRAVWYARADAAIAVADQEQRTLTADRAVVLREAADHLARQGRAREDATWSDREAELARGWQDAAHELRHLAAETGRPETHAARCGCGHPADEHSVYGCADGCGCEWMPKRASWWGVCDGCGAAAGPDCDCPPTTAETPQPETPPADRAAVLEVATLAERLPIADRYRHHSQLADAWDDGRDAVVRLLRRRGDEAQRPVCAECDHPKAAHREGDDPVTPGTCSACGDEDRHDYVTSGARQNGAQTQPTPKPPAAYNDGMGSGRVYCLTCPRPDDVDVPLTIDDVDLSDLCPSCGRHVVDVALDTEPAVVQAGEEA